MSRAHAFSIKSTSRPKARSRGVLAILVFGVLAGALATAFVTSVLWPSWPGAVVAPDAPSLPITVGGATFNVPPAAIRIPVQRRAGAQERIDLNFLWPSLEPPDPHAKPAPGERDKAAERLFVTIAASAGALAAEDRLKSIYPRYASEDGFTGPDGLQGVRFRDGTPYQGEDLFIDTTAPGRFTARCTRAANPTPGICLIERRISDAVITVRFPRDWLPGWRDLVVSIDRMIAAMRPVGS